jgi:hypothetical protein
MVICHILPLESNNHFITQLTFTSHVVFHEAVRLSLCELKDARFCSQCCGNSIAGWWNSAEQKKMAQQRKVHIYTHHNARATVTAPTRIFGLSFFRSRTL